MSDAEGSEEEEEEKLDPCVLVSRLPPAACKAGDSKQAKEAPGIRRAALP